VRHLIIFSSYLLLLKRCVVGADERRCRPSCCGVERASCWSCGRAGSDGTIAGCGRQLRFS